ELVCRCVWGRGAVLLGFLACVWATCVQRSDRRDPCRVNGSSMPFRCSWTILRRGSGFSCIAPNGVLLSALPLEFQLKPPAILVLALVCTAIQAVDKVSLPGFCMQFATFVQFLLAFLLLVSRFLSCAHPIVFKGQSP